VAPNVLGLSASPRRDGNSDLLLAEALAGAASAGAATEPLRLADFAIAPCVECNACLRTGVCRVEDDFQAILARMLAADRIIFATPIFFMGVAAQGKLLIDRCQCLWARKYVLKQPLPEGSPRDRRAMVIAVGGSKGRKMFDSVRLTMKYYFDALGAAYVSSLFVNQVDERGAVRRHRRALEEARRLGRELVTDSLPPPPTPRDLVLVGGPEVPGLTGREQP
jgi:multimeric flavodoxin WrbA